MLCQMTKSSYEEGVHGGRMWGGGRGGVCAGSDSDVLPSISQSRLDGDNAKSPDGISTSVAERRESYARSASAMVLVVLVVVVVVVVVVGGGAERHADIDAAAAATST
ncbi:unnamed protein product [Pleuronectes platessa]|uniref:Uncharacterized protein n=1 Tax=Pleuronectes platessa TaxID=8262 RepID=A0A9N7V8I7_PLEPL|nr:unnamed protein product [Pleuronectes platessa]